MENRGESSIDVPVILFGIESEKLHQVRQKTLKQSTLIKESLAPCITKDRLTSVHDFSETKKKRIRETGIDI